MRKVHAVGSAMEKVVYPFVVFASSEIELHLVSTGCGLPWSPVCAPFRRELLYLSYQVI